MSHVHEEPRIFQPGDAFRQYPFVVVEYLGEGASGQVYRIEHRNTGDRFALKVGHLADRKHAKKVARQLIEATATYRLGHRNIVRVFDLGCESDGMVWQRMELLDGRSLADLLRCYGRLSPLLAIKVVREIADALQAAHEQQVIHRDVQASNVFITSKGLVVVLDFSLAKVIPSGLETTRNHPMGTTACMAPEQLDPNGLVTPQCDVYALGLLLWQLWTGRHPFQTPDDTVMTLVIKQLHQEPESLVTAAGLPACCDEVIRDATAKDPRRRYRDMWAFSEALRDLHERLATDPEAPESVWLPPQWESAVPIACDPARQSEYSPPTSLPRGLPVPAIPSKRIVVSPALGASPPARPRLAPTVPMAAVADAPPAAPSRGEPAPATVRGAARSRPRGLWAVVIAAPLVVALGVGLALLAMGDGSAAQGPSAPTSAAAPTSAPARAAVPASSARVERPRAPATRSKK